MEALYTKLFEKYNSLKKRKFSELDGINKEQEEKFMNYVSAAEELVEYLRNQHKSLQMQVSNLRSELALLRSAKDEEVAEYQKLLSEENQKSKMLRGEIQRLQKLQQMRGDNPENQSTERTTRKLVQDAIAVEESIIPPEHGNLNITVARETVTISKEPASIEDHSHQQLEYCRTNLDSGGISLNGSASANSQFQALLECLVGMELSTVNKTEGMCISALHQSSGFSFSLTWVEKAAGEEPELLYRVATLGTFDAIAPEWMRSSLMFSMNMCPIFFERISKVIKLQRR